MPSAAPIILDDASLPLVHAWRQTLLTTPSAALELLAGLAGDAPPQLAQQFYTTLMEDPRANRFLDHDQVRNRLQPAMQRWLVQLLCARADQVEQLISHQGVIGDVHARVGIPVDLVGRGMRVLLIALIEQLHQRSSDPALAQAASLCLLNSICIAQEGMTQSYTRAKERSARADAAYRLFSLVQNVSAERERQRALLLDWENQLLYALASPDSLATIEPLTASEFGLWFIHKGIPSFGQNSETEHLSSLITQTDQLLAQLQAGGVAQTANLMPAIRQQLEQIRALQTMLFERIGELDSGSDPLTNLLNRRFLPTVLRREIELTTSNGTRFAVLLIDLDHFKSINDRYGHETGDRALLHVATTLSQHTRGSDYLFRYGGEEFVVVLVGVSALQAMVIAENLLGRIRNAPLKLANDNELVLTASIGVAAFDGHPDYQRLMARADAAMYQAKNGGRDQVQLAP